MTDNPADTFNPDNMPDIGGRDPAEVAAEAAAAVKDAPDRVAILERQLADLAASTARTNDRLMEAVLNTNNREQSRPEPVETVAEEPMPDAALDPEKFAKWTKGEIAKGVAAVTAPKLSPYGDSPDNIASAAFDVFKNKYTALADPKFDWVVRDAAREVNTTLQGRRADPYVLMQRDPEAYSAKIAEAATKRLGALGIKADGSSAPTSKPAARTGGVLGSDMGTGTKPEEKLDKPGSVVNEANDRRRKMGLI